MDAFKSVNVKYSKYTVTLPNNHDSVGRGGGTELAAGHSHTTYSKGDFSLFLK